MNYQDRYFAAFAGKISRSIGKPSAIVMVVAFFFIFTFFVILIGLSIESYFILIMAISMITLLMLVLLHHSDRQDMTELRARLNALEEETQGVTRPDRGEKLSAVELRQVRSMLEQHADRNDEAARRDNRDWRPSLF